MIELLVLEPVMSGNSGLLDAMVDEENVRSDEYEGCFPISMTGSALTCSCRGLMGSCSGWLARGFMAGTYDLARLCSSLWKLSPGADEGTREIGSSGDMGLDPAKEPARLLIELNEFDTPGDIGPAPGLGIAFLVPTPSSLKSSRSSASFWAHLPRTDPTSMLFHLPAIE